MNYLPFRRTRNVWRVVVYSFSALIALIFLLISGSTFLKYVSFNSHSAQITATLTNIIPSDTYQIVDFSYSLNDKSYTNSINISNDVTLTKGDEYKIYYDTTNPNVIHTTAKKSAPSSLMVYLFIEGVIFVFGVVRIVIELSKPATFLPPPPYQPPSQQPMPPQYPPQP